MLDTLRIEPFLGFLVGYGFPHFQKPCFGCFLGGIGQHPAVRVRIVFLSDVVPDGKGIFGVWERIGSHDDLKAFLWRLGLVLCRNPLRKGKHFIDSGFCIGRSLFSGSFFNGGFFSGFCFFGLCLVLRFPVPVGFGSHYLR